MKKIKDKVKSIMDSIDTREMSSNRFAIEYYDRVMYWHSLKYCMLNWPSVWGISRARRSIIATDPKKYGRITADSQSVYIEEYGRECIPSNS